MGTTKKTTENRKTKPLRPATNPEARENQLIALATDLAEEQMRNGTASSQIIAYYLKLGSPKDRLEREKLKLENELTKAKTQQIASMQKIEELYAEAMNAMKNYTGNSDDGDDEYAN